MPSTYRLLVTFLSILGLTFAHTGVGHTADHGQRVRAIVDLHHGVDPRSVGQEMAQRHNGEVMFVYEHVLNGFAGVFPESRLDSIERDPRVESVELDQEVHAFAQTVPTGVQRIFADDNGNIDIDGTDDYRVDVDVAVIDTGIDLDHPDLNVAGSVDCFYSNDGGPPWSRSYYCDAGGDDDNGHGTHVAGTIGAIDNGQGVVGVAPGARMWAVKVLDSSGSGYMSNVIAGVDWVTSTRTDTDATNDIAVANMSLGCECSSAELDQALTDSVNEGVAYAVAAGNSSMDVADYTPAGHPDVLTVSALADFDGEPGGLVTDTSSECRDDEDDTFANFSNYGSGVDVIAPGVCILSTVPGGGYDTYSGTSMASPHSAGALALLASGESIAIDSNGVHTFYATVEDAGNGNWNNSDDGDMTQEPLLDVSDTSVFGSGDLPPSVSVTSPQDGATVSGTSVTVSADASDDGTVTQVEFFVGSTSIGVDSDGSDGWSTSWDTTAYADGSHTVTATATDDAGQTASHSVTVTVDNVDDPPSVSVTNPADGSTVSGSVTVKADAEDDRGMTQVEFFVGSTSIGVDSDGSDGWSASWDTTAYADGSHTVTATATDDAGQTASHSVTVTVDNSVNTATVSTIGYDTWGGPDGLKHLGVTLTVVEDASGNPISGAAVSIVLELDRDGDGTIDDSWTATGTTGDQGTVRFELKNAPSGTYTTTVTDVTADGYTWDGATPENSFTK